MTLENITVTTIETNGIKEIKNTIVSTLKALETADNSSKVLFNDTVSYLKTTSDINQGIKAMKNMIDEAIVEGKYTNYYKNKMNSIVNYSAISCNSKLAINTTLMHWYNVEKSLKLMEHLLTNVPNDVSKVRNLLQSLKGKAVNKLTTRIEKNKYNELLASKLSELYKEYKLEEDDDAKTVKIEHLFNAMDKEHKEALIKKLTTMLQ